MPISRQHFYAICRGLPDYRIAEAVREASGFDYRGQTRQTIASKLEWMAQQGLTASQLLDAIDIERSTGHVMTEHEQINDQVLCWMINGSRTVTAIAHASGFLPYVVRRALRRLERDGRVLCCDDSTPHRWYLIDPE